MREAGFIPRAVLLAVLSLAVGLVGGYLSLWQALDHRVFALLQGRVQISPDAAIRIVDIAPAHTVSESDKVRDFRLRLAQVLTSLAEDIQLPRVVILDVWFARENSGIAPLEQAIGMLRKRGVRVYAAVNLLTRQGAVSGDPMAAHHERLYGEVLDGFGHSLLEHGYGVLRYRRDVPIPMRAGQAVVGEGRLPALAVVAALDANRWPALPESVIVPLGNDKLLVSAIDRISADTATAVVLRPLRGATHVIIGNLDEDSDNLLNRPGPLLMAWALSDLLAGRTSVSLAPLNQALISMLLALSAAAVGWMTFASAFGALRARVSPSRWPTLLLVLAAVALLAGGALLWIVQIVVVAGGHVAPIVWPTVTLLLAVLIAAWGGYQWVQETITRAEINRSAEEKAIAYDVFVSYAHDPPENQAWVRTHIAEPLSKLRHSDGRPWRVFFDERSIKPGRAWKREIELALLGTRCFVPVYSQRYFDRPYCREEIEMADQLRIEGRLAFVPVARIKEGVPERYLRKVQYLDATDSKSVTQRLTEQVLAESQRLSHGSAVDDTTAETKGE